MSFAAVSERVNEAVAARRFDEVARLLIDAARAALHADGWKADEREKLAKLLNSHQQFGYARRVYRRLYEDPAVDAGRKQRIRERYARAVYKDLELSASRRHDRALEILREGGPESTWSAEALGLAGAVYKRRWQAEAKLADLQNAYDYYDRGWQQKGDPERPYCGINAAFVLDQLAAVDRTGRVGAAPQAQALQKRAQDIRRTIVAELAGGKLEMWDMATLGEAHFGLGEFPEAQAAMRDYVRREPKGWERETTASQLAELARLHDPDAPSLRDEAAAVLGELVGSADALVRRAEMGKIGLALSGGGFRASLFHIGVLARLAEHDVLRSVEVLSCVSGGSIVGALYYLRLRHLLESKPDDKIDADDYVKLVQTLADDFLSAVQRNPRVRLTSNVSDNWKMAARSDYSRTDRIAELLEELLYQQVERTGGGDWRMSDLLVNPHGREGFSPRYENWEREAKVPVLVINATTLNTGHSWQFTASWMGEPPDAVDERIDANPRLRRMYYRDAPKAYREHPPRLSVAVAASACVPALFPPIQLDGLYDGITVELVDGGVHDNQGIASLVEQECAVVLVSDASGQMGDRPEPGRALLSVASRSNSILQSRVRGAQLVDLGNRRRAGSLRRLVVMHLKKRLPAEPMNWGKLPDDPCPEPYQADLDERATAQATSVQDYRIAEDVQRALADIRTDLDSFSDIEAHALMAAGYQMAGHELREDLPDLPVRVQRPQWVFDAMIGRLSTPFAQDRELEIALTVGSERFGKGLRAWWKRRAGGSGRGRRVLDATTGAAGRGGRAVVAPVRALVAVPVSVIGAAGTRAYLETFGRIRRRRA